MPAQGQVGRDRPAPPALWLAQPDSKMLGFDTPERVAGQPTGHIPDRDSQPANVRVPRYGHAADAPLAASLPVEAPCAQSWVVVLQGLQRHAGTRADPVRNGQFGNERLGRRRR
jgi:hypothetical protein